MRPELSYNDNIRHDTRGQVTQVEQSEEQVELEALYKDLTSQGQIMTHVRLAKCLKESCRLERLQKHDRMVLITKLVNQRRLYYELHMAVDLLVKEGFLKTGTGTEGLLHD